jgi:hypothetical protein
MPKITVNEDRNSLTQESDIRTSRQSLMISTKAEPYSPEIALNQSFQRTVFELHALHRARTLSGRHMIRHDGIRDATRQSLFVRQNRSDSSLYVFANGR